MLSLQYFPSVLLTGKPVVVLSPHLDDAIWSLGMVLRSITQAGRVVRIVTLFSNTPDAATRQAEDRRAAQAVGCEIVHVGFPDAILSRPLDAVFDAAFTPDMAHSQRMAARVRTAVPRGAVVLAPSGFGNHIDHLATRAVGAQAGNPTLYYEDFPYAARSVRRENAAAFLAAHDLHRHTIPAAATDISEQLALYNLYTSQRAGHHEVQIQTYLARYGFGLWGNDAGGRAATK